MDISFPRKIAEGDAFCDREQERAYLKKNIERGFHTLIISPRRYGKTSLAMKTFTELKMPFGYTQFLNAYQPEVMMKRFVICLNQLLTQLETPTQKTLKSLGEFFSRAKLNLKVSEFAVGIEIEPVLKDPELVMFSLLEGIEKVLVAKNKKAIIFLDEFQDIAEASMSDSFQSILRDFAQRSRQVVFVVSGSTRHLLAEMFLDRNKPFYKLFDQLDLGRISREDYQLFLQKKAKKQWKEALSDAVLKQVFFYTECHTYYMNRLCEMLWRFEALPGEREVALAWQEVLEGEFDSVAEDLSQLTKNQRVVLQAIAKENYVLEPASKEFLLKTEMAHGSVLLAIKVLDQKDFVGKDPEKGYFLIDPAMKAILSK